jgi:hypothetical protein
MRTICPIKNIIASKQYVFSYPTSDAMEECLEVDLGECPSKSESDRYRNDSLLGKFEITKALLRLTDPAADGPLPSGVRPSGVRPGDAPSYLEENND